jgi:hypothetical protein
MLLIFERVRGSDVSKGFVHRVRLTDNIAYLKYYSIFNDSLVEALHSSCPFHFTGCPRLLPKTLG